MEYQYQTAVQVFCIHTLFRDGTSGYVKVPSKQISDAMVEAFKDRLKDQ